MSACRTIKIVLLGEGNLLQRLCFRFETSLGKQLNHVPHVPAGRVGKTSLALRFVHKTFNHSQQATLQASFLSKRVTAEGKEVKTCASVAAWFDNTIFDAIKLSCRLSLQSGIQLAKSASMLWVQYTIEMRRLPCWFMT